MGVGAIADIPRRSLVTFQFQAQPLFMPKRKQLPRPRAGINRDNYAGG